MRGHPILGAVAGLLFGAFVALDLIFFRVMASDSVLVVVIPLVGLLLGVGMAAWAPLGARGARPGTVAGPEDGASV